MTVTGSSDQFFILQMLLQQMCIRNTVTVELKSQGPGTQLKQALTSIMVTSNFIIFNKTALRLPGG